MLSDILLFGFDKYKDIANEEILVHTINFLNPQDTDVFANLM